ncbi:MAG: dihydrofolate reductase family protein [Luteimonas sp.]
MRKLIVAAFVSLDGVLQGPGGPQEDTSGGFAHGGWTVPFADPVFGEAIEALFAQPFELLLGRRTYDIFAAHWPRVPADHGDTDLATLFNGVTKHVATHRPDSLDWQNSRALGEDIISALHSLKAQDGPDLLTQGSGALVQQLLATDLVDTLQLMTFPVLLGAGKRLFGNDAQAVTFSLEKSVVSPTGIVVSRYARAGEVQTGSFGLD